MILASPDLAEPVPRLLEALRARGHRVETLGSGIGARAMRAPVRGTVPTVLRGLVGPGGAEPAAPEGRLLVIGLIGTHPDARSAALRELWQMEERARGQGRPVLAMRLGPLIGPASPLWLRLRSNPRLPRGGRKLLQPVLEEDVVEAIHRALAGQARWEGCHEIAGPEVWSLAELARLAADSSDTRSESAGAWEPSLDVLEEQRLCEVEPWLEHFGIEARSLAAAAEGWAA